MKAAAAPLVLTASAPGEYLGGDDVIETSHPGVRSLAASLRAAHQDDRDFARASFEWVRDQIAHSCDAGNPRVTVTASQVLHHGVGLCFAKSHLLAALLRSGGVPAGLCYQRLSDGNGGHLLHGLAAIYLDGRWHRQDPRGNRPGVDARFSLDGECLAYTVNPDAGEIDYPEVRVMPSPAVLRALCSATDVLVLCDGGLPSDPG